jgi:hypothetical protein
MEEAEVVVRECDALVKRKTHLTDCACGAVYYLSQRNSTVFLAMNSIVLRLLIVQLVLVPAALNQIASYHQMDNSTRHCHRYHLHYLCVVFHIEQHPVAIVMHCFSSLLPSYYLYDVQHIPSRGYFATASYLQMLNQWLCFAILSIEPFEAVPRIVPWDLSPLHFVVFPQRDEEAILTE